MKSLQYLNARFEELKIAPRHGEGVLVENNRENVPPPNRAACRHRLCANAPPHDWAECTHNRRGKNYRPNKHSNGERGRKGRGGREGRGGGLGGRGNHGRGNRGGNDRGSGNGGNVNANSNKIGDSRKKGGCGGRRASDCESRESSGNGSAEKRGRVSCEVIDLTTPPRGKPEGKEMLSPRARPGENVTGENEASKNNGSGEGPRRDEGSVGRWEGRGRPGSGGGASGRMPDAKSPHRVHEVELVGGLQPVEYVNELRAACVRNGSMLQTVLDRIRFHASLRENDYTFDSSGSSSYNVVIKKSHIASINKHHYSIVLESNRELSKSQKGKLREVFAKHDAAGFPEWLGGAARGWRFDSATEGDSWKRRSAARLNSLQGVFTLFARDKQKYFFVEEKKRMVWRKQSELTEIVSDVRVWIEILRPSALTRRLLRNSGAGPDSPVHWAHHHPATSYPLTVVTESTMLELVKGVIELFQQEFHHSAIDPLGTRWRGHEKRRRSDWEEAAKVCPEWTEDRLEKLLNHPPISACVVGSWNA